MVNKSQIRKFVDINVERQLVREYLLKETERAGFGGLHFERAFEGTSMCTKITLKTKQIKKITEATRWRVTARERWDPGATQ